MLDELPREEVHAAVDHAVAELLRAAGIEQPPVDAIALAQRHLGMIVCLDRRQEQRGRAQRSGGSKQIFLRPEPSEERHQWTVAHEIGEHQKAVLLARLGVPPDRTQPMAGESLANLFATHLLVPSLWFAADARACGFDVLALKQRYATVSHEVIAWRLLDLPEPSIITIVDNGDVRRRRSNSWPVNRKLATAEQECQRAVSDGGAPCTRRCDGWTVHGWPIHQADWKREILRSVVDGELC